MSSPNDLIGPYTRPVARDPAAWVTVAIVAAATAASAGRAWSESASVRNALAVGALTLVLTSIATVFVVAVVVGIPRGWRLGRRDRSR